MEFTQKIKEAVDTFVSESKTNFNELKYTAESTLKNVISEAQDELEVQKNNIKTTSERVQAKLKGPFTVEKVQADVQEELNILVGELKNTYGRNTERVKNLMNTTESKVKAATKEVKEEVKKATKAAKEKVQA
jgi:ElaB/YqjD/DUF883 family membrane-anchored ribosome-binding protein